MAKKVKYLKQVAVHLERRYGQTKAQTIMGKALKRYEELIEENKDEPKEYYMHTRQRIYPSIAVFDAIISEGIDRGEAADFVVTYYKWRSSNLAPKLKAIMKIPGLYKVAPKFFYSMTRKSFGPQAGFASDNIHLGKNDMGFDMTKFGFATFWAGAVVNAIPGIIAQIILIPMLIMALEKAKLMQDKKQ